MALFGAAMLRGLLSARLQALELPQQSARLVLALIVTASAVLWLGLATAQMAGDAAAMVDPHLLMMTITQTEFGQWFLVRLVLLVLLCLGIALKWPGTVLTVLSGTALALIAVTSHAAQASPAHFIAIGAVTDGLHLLTGGYWIGGLALLAMLFARRTAPALLASAVALFAEWGMIAVTILVLTGMLNAATILLGGEGHDTRLYLAVLGTKLLLVLAMIGLALVNHFRLLPGMTGTADRLQSNIRLELGLGIVVVGLAALLGLLPPTM
jgi:putative copper resistance protein D